MACIGCGEGKYKRGVCRAHQLIEKDSKSRLVRFCELCGVSLCTLCWKSPLRRIKAFGKQFFTNE